MGSLVQAQQDGGPLRGDGSYGIGVLEIAPLACARERGAGHRRGVHDEVVDLDFPLLVDDVGERLGGKDLGASGEIPFGAQFVRDELLLRFAVAVVLIVGHAPAGHFVGLAPRGTLRVVCLETFEPEDGVAIVLLRNREIGEEPSPDKILVAVDDGIVGQELVEMR